MDKIHSMLKNFNSYQPNDTTMEQTIERLIKINATGMITELMLNGIWGTEPWIELGVRFMSKLQFNSRMMMTGSDVQHYSSRLALLNVILNDDGNILEDYINIRDEITANYNANNYDTLNWDETNAKMKSSGRAAFNTLTMEYANHFKMKGLTWGCENVAVVGEGIEADIVHEM